MSLAKAYSDSTLGPALLLGCLAFGTLSACVSSPAGIADAEAGSGGSPLAESGSSSVANAGSLESSDGGDAQGGSDAGGAEAGHTARGGATGHAGAAATGGNGGTEIESGGSRASAGSGGTVGEAGAGGQDSIPEAAVIPPSCPFHTPPVSAGGAGGATSSGGGSSGGAAGAAGAPATTVTIQVSAFLGNYLADANGRSLYTYGGDLPGDCHTPPVSLCVTDCLVSWPSFPAGARVLPAGLDDNAFGAIHRDDGTWQTTYFGWPLYYYKPDLALGQVSGQGKGKTWHLAQQKPPGVVILKIGTLKYLADGAGHTLYVSAADVSGTGNQAPVSHCDATCLSRFEPFHETNFSVVTSLSPADFGSFVRPGRADLQIAYKGMPLYRAASDLKAGDTTGTTVTGFTPAAP